MNVSDSVSGGLHTAPAAGPAGPGTIKTWQLRWAGRLIGVISAGFFAMFAIGEIVTGIQTGEFNPEGIAPVSLILVAALGVLMSFYWERAGGFLTLVGGLGMGLLVLMLGGINDARVALIFAAPLGIAGALSWICGTRAAAARSGHAD